MKLYNFLLSKMLTYGNKLAFANSNIGNLQVPKNAKIFKSYCFFESHLQIDELKIYEYQMNN